MIKANRSSLNEKQLRTIDIVLGCFINRKCTSIKVSYNNEYAFINSVIYKNKIVKVNNRRKKAEYLNTILFNVHKDGNIFNFKVKNYYE